MPFTSNLIHPVSAGLAQMCWLFLILFLTVFVPGFCEQSTKDQFVNKCCDINKHYEDGQCVDTGQSTYHNKKWTPPRTMVFDNVTEVADYPVVFQWHLAQPNCTDGVIEKIIWNNPQQADEGVNETSDINHPDVILSSDGILTWTDDSKFLNRYPPEKFCIDQVNNTAYVAVVCKPKCTDETPCLRKCCDPDDILDLANQTCVSSPMSWKSHFFSPNLTYLTKADDAPPHYIVGVPKCRDLFILRYNQERFYALSNGSLLTVTGNVTHVYPPNSYCIDNLTEVYSGETTIYPDYISGYDDTDMGQIAVICLAEDEEEELTWIYPLFAGFMSISAIFLVLTAAVYLILWEYQNIHGWLQFSYVVSLLFAFSFLSFVQFFAPTLHVHQEICEFFGSVIHFSFLSAFFWLTSMNFDLWWTFSGCRPLRASTRTGEKKRFAFFGLLSWGSAILIASTGVALDAIYKGDHVISEYLPQFGKDKCYFHNEWAKLPFFYAPIGFLLCVNAAFFVSTILSLHKLQRDTRFATRQSSNQDKKRFVLFLKLFVLMGVCWIFEMISWLSILLSPKSEHNKLKLGFLFTDILNAAQGVFIFIIFTCKPNTCKQLEGQFKKLSVRLEESRDKTSLSDSKMARFFAIGFCAVILPIVHGFRKLFSYCGRPKRSLEGRRTISHNTVTSTFEKSRKASDSSACTTLSVVDAGAFEMDTTY